MIPQDLMYTLAAHVNLELCDAGKKITELNFFLDEGEDFVIEGTIQWDDNGMVDYDLTDVTFSDNYGELHVMTTEQEQFLSASVQNFTE